MTCRSLLSKAAQRKLRDRKNSFFLNFDLADNLIFSSTFTLAGYMSVAVVEHFSRV